MTHSEPEYQRALARLEEDQEVIEAQKKVFLDQGLTHEEAEKALQPMISFRAQLEDEVSWYEQVRRRDFGVLENLSALGTTLIALRIANGFSQKELADRMGVSEAQVSRDERNEYHGITVERAQKVLDAMGETLESRVEHKPLAPA
jgi:DNA-directed RNA polymerase specialized sigma subunit